MAKKAEKNTEILNMKNATLDALVTKVHELKKQLMNLRFQKTGGQLKDMSQLGKAKKNVARLKTFANLQKGKEAQTTAGKTKTTKKKAGVK